MFSSSTLFSVNGAACVRRRAKRAWRSIGDAPIFVAHDSADVWSHPDLFQLDAKGRPTHVAGTPPDYFSADGQRWGNPLYRWDRLAKTGYAWWIDRIVGTLALFDVVRLDHFIGFYRYWRIPAKDKTAAHGAWYPGPRDAFFRAVFRRLGHVPIVAEDLGAITPEIVAMRDRFHLPGMRVLQFAFGKDTKTNVHLPHTYPHNSVVYTGTHDNDTVVGWFRDRGGAASARGAERIEERATARAGLHEQRTDAKSIGILSAWRKRPSRTSPSFPFKTFWDWAPTRE